jgi:hypothetical protein
MCVQKRPYISLPSSLLGVKIWQQVGLSKCEEKKYDQNKNGNIFNWL